VTSEEPSAETAAQDAFLGLLVTPLVSVHEHSDLFYRVLSHRTVLTGWAGKLGYRLVIAGTVARLHRDPAGPQLTSAPPAWNPPSRRVLVLTALTAAACEDTDLTTTVQVLSDEVLVLSASPGSHVTPYDPDLRSERQAFLAAVNLLARLGILIRRTSDESLLRQWEQDGRGVGAGFEVDREALLQFADPYTVSLALQAQALDEEAESARRTATRMQRLLRMLVEGTALLYADLHPADAEYARTQRSRLAASAEEMTGGTVETRAEGMLLRLPDRPGSSAVPVPFPVATAVSWFALQLLDAAATGRVPDGDGRIVLNGAEVASVAAQVYRDNKDALTVALQESPERMRTEVEPVLTGTNLIRVAPAGWTILPVAGRYRDPAATWEPAWASREARDHERDPDPGERTDHDDA
jgi:uncharacterized protein (TIGR02678 family)